MDGEITAKKIVGNPLQDAADYPYSLSNFPIFPAYYFGHFIFSSIATIHISHILILT